MELLFSHVTTLDILVVLVFLIFLVRGIWVGFIRQISSIIAMVAGYVVAGQFSENFYLLVLPFVNNTKITFIITYILLFVLIYFLVIFLGIGLKKVMTISLLNWFDRTIGGLFGLAKALFFVSIMYMILASSLAGSSKFLKEAICYPLLSQTSQIITLIISDPELRTRFLPWQPAIILPDQEAQSEAGKQADPAARVPVETLDQPAVPALKGE